MDEQIVAKVARAVSFMQIIEPLKSATRTAWTQTGRRESVAEHSWRLAMLGLLVSLQNQHLDGGRLVALCLVHDLAECLTGDVSAAARPDAAQKRAQEYRAMKELCAPLSALEREALFSLWQEYEEGTTCEARMAKALDKAETILQHQAGKNPPGFDYAFNLHYGKDYFKDDSYLVALRAALDAGTRQRARRESSPCGGRDGPHKKG
ncbi:5'-nucleotidase yfbR [uncultured Clostridium sp.]|nr:5'-nucleotidase yfbR [uncultured Clostridium sp.]